MFATITKKGQVTIPVRIRRKYGMKTGDKILWQLQGTEARFRLVDKDAAQLTRQGKFNLKG